MAADNAKQMLHGKYGPNTMDTVQDSRHTEAWERLCNSKELQTNIPLVSLIKDKWMTSELLNQINLKNGIYVE